MYFLHSEFLSNLRLSWKTEFAREFFTVLNMYFLSFRIFEQLPLALKKQSCPENFHCIEYTFYIPDFEPLALALKDRGCHEYTVLNMYILLFRNFEQLAVALKNTVYPEIFTVLNMYFLSFRIFEQLGLALKNRVDLEFFTVLNMYFLLFRIFEQLAVALKTEFALKIFKPGGRPPVPTPHRTPMNVPLLCVVPPQNSIFCGADIGSTIDLL